MLGKAIRGAIIIFILSILGSVLSYTFRIILARSLSIAEYGLFYSMYAFFSVMIIFIDLGLSQAVIKHVIDLNAARKYAISKFIILGTLSVQLTISSIIFLFTFVFREEISHTVFKIDDTSLIVLMGVWFMTLPFSSFLTNIFTGRKRMEISSSQELFRQGASLALTLVFLYMNFGVKSPFLAYMFINFLMILVYSPIIRIIYPGFASLKIEYDKSTFWSVFKYGSYIIFSSLISTVILQTDTVLLTLMKGTESVGLYQTAMPLALLITYFSGTVLTVAYPYVTELNALKRFDDLRTGLTMLYKYTLIISLPISIVLFSYSELIISTLFEQKYAGAALTLQILAVSTIFSTFTSINNTMLLAAGHPGEIVKNMILAAIVNLLLNISFIPRYGIEGAATASFACFIIAFGISASKLKKKLSFSFPLKNFITLLIIGAILTGTIFWLREVLDLSQWLEIAFIGLVTGSLYVALLFSLRLVNVAEIKEFIRVTLKRG